MSSATTNKNVDNPMPASSETIRETRTSCRSVSEAFGLEPNLEAIDSFLTQLDQPTFERLCVQHGLSFPLRFPTVVGELNFFGILALLNAFSGYRTPFHKATGIGAYQNVIRFLIGLYISSSEAEDRSIGSAALTAKGMQSLTEAKVVELLGVSIHQEKQHDSLPGVTVGVRGGDMFDCVQLIRTTMNNVGSTLVEMGFNSFGDYLVRILKHATQECGDGDEGLDDGKATDYLVRQIASDFPEFRDSHSFSAPSPPSSTAEAAEKGKQDKSQQEVYIFKRIFFLLHSLNLRFGPQSQSQSQNSNQNAGAGREWKVPNTLHVLPMFVDNVLPTLCVWFNFFHLSPPPAGDDTKSTLYDWVQNAHIHADLSRQRLQQLEKNLPGPTLTADETYTIRAATLNIGTIITNRAHHLAQKNPAKHQWLENLNEVDLDAYLWSLAKDDPLIRKVPRLVFPSIHF